MLATRPVVEEKVPTACQLSWQPRPVKILHVLIFTVHSKGILQVWHFFVTYWSESANFVTYWSKSANFGVKPLPELSPVLWDGLCATVRVLSAGHPTGWAAWWGICWHVEWWCIIGQGSPHLPVPTALSDGAPLSLAVTWPQTVDQIWRVGCVGGRNLIQKQASTKVLHPPFNVWVTSNQTQLGGQS